MGGAAAAQKARVVGVTAAAVMVAAAAKEAVAAAAAGRVVVATGTAMRAAPRAARERGVDAVTAAPEASQWESPEARLVAAPLGAVGAEGAAAAAAAAAAVGEWSTATLVAEGQRSCRGAGQPRSCS